MSLDAVSSHQKDKSPTMPLLLDPTGEWLGGPKVGDHDNTRPVPAELQRCMTEWERVSGH